MSDKKEEKKEEEDKRFDQEQYLLDLDDVCIQNCNACPKCDNN